jgi:uncharacterized DUF497 family protein
MGEEGFDWEDGNLEKCQKHGVSVAEIEAFFLIGPRVAPDLRHSDYENRYVAIGRNEEGRAMFVAYVVRMRDGVRLIRPVSARYMHRKEAERYAKKSS